MLWMKPPKSVDDREIVSPVVLQLAITEAVKTFDPDCEMFVGIFVERATAKSRSDANWAVKGIKFGKADRDKCSHVVATVVEGLKRKYNLPEGQRSL
jgi:hypothetical protein